jgi:hypothetical protein
VSWVARAVLASISPSTPTGRPSVLIVELRGFLAVAAARPAGGYVFCRPGHVLKQSILGTRFVIPVPAARRSATASSREGAGAHCGGGAPRPAPGHSHLETAAGRGASLCRDRVGFRPLDCTKVHISSRCLASALVTAPNVVAERESLSDKQATAGALRVSRCVRLSETSGRSRSAALLGTPGQGRQSQHPARAVQECNEMKQLAQLRETGSTRK